MQKCVASLCSHSWGTTDRVCDDMRCQRRHPGDAWALSHSAKDGTPPPPPPSVLPHLFSYPLFLWMNTLDTGCWWWCWWLTLPDGGNLINEVASVALARPPPPPTRNWSHMPVYSFGDPLPPRCHHHAEGLTPPQTPLNFLLLSPSQDAKSVQ